jgi:hypothetical protein
MSIFRKLYIRIRKKQLKILKTYFIKVAKICFFFTYIHVNPFNFLKNAKIAVPYSICITRKYLRGIVAWSSSVRSRRLNIDVGFYIDL